MRNRRASLLNSKIRDVKREKLPLILIQFLPGLNLRRENIVLALFSSALLSDFLHCVRSWSRVGTMAGPAVLDAAKIVGNNIVHKKIKKNFDDFRRSIYCVGNSTEFSETLLSLK